MMYYGNSGIGWASMIFGMILVTILVAAFIWAIVRSTTPVRGHENRTTLGGDDALLVLQRRYATSEIDEQEYERRRTVLLRSH